LRTEKEPLSFGCLSSFVRPQKKSHQKHTAGLPTYKEVDVYSTHTCPIPSRFSQWNIALFLTAAATVRQRLKRLSFFPIKPLSQKEYRVLVFDYMYIIARAHILVKSKRKNFFFSSRNFLLQKA
jgi:hypothetical protein